MCLQCLSDTSIISAIKFCPCSSAWWAEFPHVWETIIFCIIHAFWLLFSHYFLLPTMCLKCQLRSSPFSVRQDMSSVSPAAVRSSTTKPVLNKTSERRLASVNDCHHTAGLVSSAQLRSLAQVNIIIYTDPMLKSIIIYSEMQWNALMDCGWFNNNVSSIMDES